MVFKIGLLGLGTVGTGTVEILLNPEGRHPLLSELSLHRVGVRSLSKPRSVNIPEYLLTTDLEEIVIDPAVDIIVELIGGLEPARSLILQAIENGKHVVTANKAVISRYGSEIFDAANQKGVYVLLEAAVGGGIPVIQPLKQSLGANRIHKVTGIINGTTNYILTRMKNEGADFADVLADAQRLGYAEADPTADIDGLDAGDKIAILASLAFGGRIKLEQVYCEGIRKVTATDITYAEKLGFVIKLLAIAARDPHATPEQDLLSVRVHPTLVPKVHPLASINDVYNAILVEGEPIGQVMFFGRGAGSGPTASAVVSDLLNIVAVLQMQEAEIVSPVVTHELMSCTHQHYCKIAPMEDLITRFYVRFLTKDSPGVIGNIGTCFGQHNVSLESIVQTGFQENLAEIVVVTHDVLEGNFHQALNEIKSLDSIDSIPSILRVL
ncbi:Homoserine dehydrogenase [Planktothrix tepida]|uniref:Homoserine dehydrogenase n=1 Tax=Planktothrix tepida PCC 9214 TaxID=671072 RepID=A0A1J1LRM2_9CYAN|nr:homoserine dehydrogenase [Planktothrix tepida]CAD5965999.1 Homoserine dehydrogenase [Planktothrix tepida]CUR35047.1 Homoserine dehydrogenase [Planktothrix tepida PCC 9214]